MLQAGAHCQHTRALGVSELQKSRQADAEKQADGLEELQDVSSNKASQPPWSESAELCVITPTPFQADSDSLGAIHHYQPGETVPHEAARWKRLRQRSAGRRCPSAVAAGAEQPRSTHLHGLHPRGAQLQRGEGRQPTNPK